MVNTHFIRYTVKEVRDIKLQMLEYYSISKCVAYKVVACAVKDGEVVLAGVNGSPSGMLNCCDHFPKGRNVPLSKWAEHSPWSKYNELHAEMNLILKALNSGMSLEGMDIFVNIQPCETCTKLLVGAKVRSIYYFNEYNDNDQERLMDFISRSNLDTYKHLKQDF